MSEKRKCKVCGVQLNDKHVMKIKVGDDSWETIPLTICPDCFKRQMRKLSGRTVARRDPNI